MRPLQPHHPDPAEPIAGRSEERRAEAFLDAGLSVTESTIRFIGRWLQDLSRDLERRIPMHAEADAGTGARIQRELAAKTLRGAGDRFVDALPDTVRRS